jgi:hypothetical protein
MQSDTAALDEKRLRQAGLSANTRRRYVLPMKRASEKRRSETARREQRRADVARVTTYHEAQLAKLLRRLQEGFRRFEAGEINAFKLDELITITNVRLASSGSSPAISAAHRFGSPRGRCRSSVRRPTRSIGGSGVPQSAPGDDLIREKSLLIQKQCSRSRPGSTPGPCHGPDR